MYSSSSWWSSSPSYSPTIWALAVSARACDTTTTSLQIQHHLILPFRCHQTSRTKPTSSHLSARRPSTSGGRSSMTTLTPTRRLTPDSFSRLRHHRGGAHPRQKASGREVLRSEVHQRGIECCVEVVVSGVVPTAGTDERKFEVCNTRSSTRRLSYALAELILLTPAEKRLIQEGRRT